MAPILAHDYDYDLLVIGAGSGGVRAARIAAGHGAKVAIAEKGALGGTCVNVGCVPKKLFVYGSHYSHHFHDAEAYGWDVKEQPTLDWGRLIRNKNSEIERLNGIYGNMLKNSGVDLKVGTAAFVDRNTVSVCGENITADKILVAVGGKPFVPDFEGSEHVITSNEAFFLNDLPKRVIIVGGGYIAVEFAGIFHAYGAHVTLVYRRSLFLRGFDTEVREHVAEQMRTQGVDLAFDTDITAVSKKDDASFTATLKDGSTVDADCVMYATGRFPEISQLNLEAAGVKTGSKSQVIVDEYSKTNVENIYAVGDVTDRVNLTPVAIAEGHAFADTVYGGNKRNIGYENIPTAVFSNPSIGTCGLTEDEAREKYGDDGISVFKTSFRPMLHTMTKREGEKTFMKLLVEKATDIVVGCHIVDHSAGDMIQLAGVAMKAGATKAHFDTTMPVHPVSAEEIVTMRTPVIEKKVAEAEKKVAAKH
jgi:glutathione reductase (NADPH)